MAIPGRRSGYLEPAGGLWSNLRMSGRQHPVVWMDATLDTRPSLKTCVDAAERSHQKEHSPRERDTETFPSLGSSETL